MDECRNDPTDEAPLTLGQERLWFLDRLDPGDPAYNIYLAHRLRGALDVEALQRAYDGVTARHAPLRTRYRTVDGVPVQQAMPPRPLTIELLDLSGAPEERVREALNERAVAPFDLENGSVIRACLARVGEDEHVLLTVLHHIAGDGWSLDVLLRELATLYNGQTPPPLEGDYLACARARRARGDNEEALAYWCDRLADPPVLELPTDRPRPAVKTSNGDVVVREFSGETARAVREAGRALRCTPFMVLLSVFELVLAERSGQDDLCVGTPIAGRDELELEGLIGYFSGVLVLRADLSGNPTVRELVLGTKESFLKSLAHQDIPFERLTTALDLPRDLSRSPLFQATFTYHSPTSVPATGFAGLAMEPFDAGAQHVKVDLSAEVMNDVDGAFHLTFSYNTDLFERESVEALGDRFAFLLNVFLADPEVRVGDLPLVDEDLRRRLEEWGTGAALGDVRPVLELVAARESNAGLLERAFEIADRLREAGVRAGNLVAIEVPRGPDLIPAMLGAWRLGAGYVPIDPDQPEARRQRMLADASVAAVVKGPKDIVAVAGGQCFDDPAYAIFTSGSSGVPKPVLVGQEALAARVAWMVPAYELRPGDRVVQFAALGFDTHAEEIWPALCAGATVVMLPDGPQSLPEVLAADPGITVLDLPTAYWRSLLEMVDEIAWPPALRLVILGGEQVDPVAIALWRKRFGDSVRLVNTYGPTEATIIATAAELGSSDESGRPPIGLPIGGVRLKVLDSRGRVVPPGVAGELWIGGAGVARGYLARAELTAERFVDGYYRTGDLVRWRTGEPGLEFLGRLDQQVKIRGIRVEPGEVEVALLTMDGVRQAVVTAFDDALVAYVVGDVSPAEVRTFAASLLPPFLVPSSVVVLDRLPLTRNGKLDVRALPSPVVRPSEEFVPPQTDAEVLVASVWSQVLGVETIGAFDNFFDLGGHSLMATRVIARIRASVEIDLPIRALFTHSTVSALATAVEDALIAEIERLTEDEAVALAGGMS
ncbi:MAG TPA: condensation domain-containing protein [Candidatus Limnocylindrales bacterium]|nr:condensation domain-containing protein [Candidatus Limnocylindrales bacterium]